VIHSVNLAVPRSNTFQRHGGPTTGIDKRPVDHPVEVRAPGSRSDGLGSGLVGDHIGDRRHHGGDQQAVYSFAREDLDRWEQRLGRRLRNGAFGENMTTVGIDVNESLLGERWLIGDDMVLEVTFGRVPCATFRGFIGELGWLKDFTAEARPGAYLKVIAGGLVRAGDPLRVIFRPEHDVTISVGFRAVTTERDLLPRLRGAWDFLDPQLGEKVVRGEGYQLDLGDPVGRQR
jgi:MOSC domain-containing protein YiiM